MSKYDDALKALDAESAEKRAAAGVAASAFQPDAYAKALDLSRETDAPASIIARDPKPFEEKAARTKYDAALQGAPALSSFLENVDNHAVARDDVENLSLLEKAIRKITGAAKTAALGATLIERQFVKPLDIAREIPSGFVQGGGMALSGAGRMLEMGGRATESLVRGAGADWLANLQVDSQYTPGGYLRSVGEPLEQLAQTIQTPQERRTLVTEGVQGLGQIGSQALIQWLTGPIGSAVTLFGQGADVMGDRADIVIAKAKEAGASPEELASLQRKADFAGVLGATWTALTEKYQLDDLINRAPLSVRSKFMSEVGDFLMAGLGEGVQEATESIGHDTLAKLTFDPSTQIGGNAAQEGTAAFISGALARLVINSIIPGRGSAFTEDHKAVAEEINTIVAKSKLAQRSPQKVEELVAEIKKQTGSETAYLDAAAFRTLYQSDQEAAQAAAELTGSQTSYFEAAVSGSKIAVPLEKYVARIATSPNAAKLVDHITFTPDGLTAAEVQASLEGFDDRVQSLAESMQSEVAGDTSQGIFDDVVGQLLATGMERSTAEKNALLTQAVFRTLAQRAGMDPMALYDKSGLRIRRDMPDLMKKPPSIDASIDPLLDRLRSGDVPKQQQAFGPSLIEFIRSKGGIVDEGGELAARDIDKGNKPFQKNVIQKDGLTLDDMAEQLVENGYIQERDPNLVLDLISKELGGQPVFAAGSENAALVGQIEQLKWLEEFIGKSGLDLKTADNATIKRALAAQAEGRTVLESTEASASLPIFTGRADDSGEGWGASRGNISEGNKSTLLVDDNGNYFWGERDLASGRDVGRVIVGKHKDFQPAKFASTKEARQAAERTTATEPNSTAATQLYQSAFHGSPFDFHRFDLSKIGTGEGAQAYGWGQYFADAKDVAENYRVNLTSRKADRVKLDGAPVAGDSMLSRSLEDIARFGKSYAIQRLDDNIKFNTSYAPDIAALYSDVKRKIEATDESKVSVDRGQLYAVDIPDAAVAKMLDWDKPLSEQPEAVKEALRGSDVAPDESVWDQYTGRQLYEGEMQASGPYNASGWANSDSQKAVSEKLLALGIPGLRYLDGGSRGTGEGTRNTVVWDQSLLDEISAGMQKTLFQSAETDPLVTLHNLTAENLSFADRIGGLPVPSLGITKADSPYTGYGNITLIGTKSLAEPSLINPVFSADAYTTRFPDVLWPKVPTKKAQAFLDSFGETYQQRDTDQLWDYLVNQPDRDKAIYEFQKSATAAKAWLKEQGEDPVGPVYEVPAPPGRAQWAAQKVWIDGIQAMRARGVDVRNLRPQDAEWAELDALAKQAVEDEIAENADSRFFAEDYREGFAKNSAGDDDVLAFGPADRAIGYVLELGAAPRVDRYRTKVALTEQIGDRKEAFEDWAAKKVAVLFGEPSIKVGGRKVPMTIENIVEAMTSRSVANKEKTMTFGGGKVAAANARKFRTIEELQDNRARVVDPQNHEDAKKSTDKILDNYRTALLQYFTEKNYRGEVDTWGALDASMKALADAAKKSATPATIRSALSKNGFRGFGSEEVDLGVDALKAIRQTAVDYFEAKPQRAVSLKEFAGAVIPADAPQEVRDILERSGVPFVEYERGSEDKQRQAVTAFAKELQAKRNDVLFQRFEETKRGAITFGADRKFTISLLEKADLSTFLHESGHLYLEIMGDLAEQPDAPQQIKDDYASILKWMGVKDRASIGVEQHEQWGRGFEAYLMEGKAPTVELQTAFARFRAWLVGIYRTIAKLNVDLTDDVRKVMDRLVATDAEIAAAEESQNYAPIFATAEEAGMSPEEWAVYKDIANKAHQESVTDLADRALRELTREQKAWWKEEREAAIKAVTDEVNAMPVYRALAFLQRGQNPDGTPLPDGIQAVKLSKSHLVEAYGKDFLKRLPRPYVYGSEGGISSDVAAQMFGFDSGPALVEALANARPKRQLIEMEADARLREKYGDMMTDGSLADQAMHAVHTGERAKVLAAELKALNRKRREVAKFVNAADRAKAREQKQAREANPLPDSDELKVIKAAVERIIAAKKVREIKPNVYRVAESQAARAAFEAAAKGKYEDAYTQKRRQILNHELYKAAVKAKEEVEAITEYMRGFDRKATRERLARAKGQFLEQIDALRERFDFTRISNIAAQKRIALAEWVKEQEEAGREIDIPAELLNETRRISYKELALWELQGLKDAVANIDHVARTKDKLLKNKAKAEWQDAKAELLERVKTALPEGKDPPIGRFDLTSMDDWSAKVRGLADSFLRPETIIEWLDGGRQGPWHDYLWNQADDSQAKREQLREQVLKPLYDLAQKINKTRRNELQEFVQIKSMGRGLNRRTLISIAMNMGNASNIERLLKGGYKTKDGSKPFTQQNLDEIRNALTKADWEFVQTVWDTVEGLWPETAEFQKRMGGLVPEKVVAVPVQTRFGTYKGGYFPVVYDPDVTRAGEKQASGDSAQEIMGKDFTKATTKKGHLKGRTAVAGPLLLDFERVMTRHMDHVITDLSHREFLLQALKILDDKDLRAQIQSRLSDTAYRSLQGMVRHAVRADHSFGEVAASGWDRITDRIISNTAVAALGFRATTAFGNLVLAPVQAGARVSPKFILKGTADFYKSPKAMAEFIHARSSMMRNRATNMDATFVETLTKLRGDRGLKAQVARASMSVHRWADFLSTHGIWLGRYQQSLDGGASEEQAVRDADSAIRQTQTAGAPKDLSAWERDPRFKLFRMFIGPMVIMGNRIREAGARRGVVQNWPEAFGTMLAVWFLPAVLWDLVTGRGPDDDDDDGMADDLSAYALREIVFYPFLTVPLLRDAADFLERKVKGDYVVPRTVPIFDAMTMVANAGEEALKASAALYEGESVDTEALVKDSLRAAGPLFGLPTSQITVTGTFLHDVATGAYDPEGVDDLRYLLIRRPE